MSSLESRIEKLEAEYGLDLNGLTWGRELARLLWYKGDDAVEAKGKEFAGLPKRRHEEWLDILNDQKMADAILRGPEKEIAMFRLRIGPSNLTDETKTMVMRDPVWVALIERSVAPLSMAAYLEKCAQEKKAMDLYWQNRPGARNAPSVAGGAQPC